MRFKRGLTPNLIVLFGATFLIASAEELWSRFVPNYLTALGASIAGVAAYGALKDLLEALYQFPGGLAGARLGYRRALLLFNVLAVCGYLAFAAAQRWWVLLIALPLVVAWQGLSLPALFASIGDSLPTGERSLGFAYQSIVRRVPIVVAPLLGGLMIARLGTTGGMRTALLIAAAIGIAVIALQATRHRAVASGGATLAELVRDAASLHPRLKALLVSDIVVRFGQGVGEIFVVLYVVSELHFSTVTFGWLVGLAMLVSIAVYVPAARIADRRGREPWVTLTYAFFALFPMVLGSSRSLPMLVLAFALMGLREIGEPARKAMIVDLARADRRSVDVGSYYLTRGLAVFPASLVGGALWRWAPQATFFGAALLAGLGALVFYVSVARRPTGSTGDR